MMQLYLGYQKFMSKLIKEAIIQAKKDGERGLTAQAIRKVQEVRANVAFFFGCGICQVYISSSLTIGRMCLHSLEVEMCVVIAAWSHGV